MRERIDYVVGWMRANPALAVFLAVAVVLIVLGGGSSVGGYDLHGPYPDY